MTEQPVHPSQYEHPGEQPYGQPTEPSYSYGADPRAYTNRELRAEVERLKRGDWTPEEVHDICHNLHGKVSAEEFAAGCAAEQRKVYGCAPDSDRVRELEAERDLLAAKVVALEGHVKRLADRDFLAAQMIAREATEKILRDENLALTAKVAALEERISLCSGSCRA